MSAEGEHTGDTPKNPKKPKDKSSRKSKKRKREEQDSSDRPNVIPQKNHTTASEEQAATLTEKDKEKKREKKKLKKSPEDGHSSQLSDNKEVVSSQVVPDSSFNNEKDKRTLGSTAQGLDSAAASQNTSISTPAKEKNEKKKKRHKKNKQSISPTDQSSNVPEQHDDSAPDNQAALLSKNSEIVPQHAPKSIADSALTIASDKDSTDSPFFVQTTCFYLPLSPIAQANPLEGLCAEHLSPFILTFAEPFNGVVLCYSNPRMEEPPPASVIRQLQRDQQKATSSRKGYKKTKYAVVSNDALPINASSPVDEDPTNSKPLARAIDEYGVTYIWIAADFLILQPQLDTWLEGHVSVQSPSQLGLVCWNLLNASIERKHLPDNWKWVGSDKAVSVKGNKPAAHEPKKGKAQNFEGYYVDGNGDKVDGMLRFRILQVDSLHAIGRDRNFMSIQGSLLRKEDEKRVDE